MNKDNKFIKISAIILIIIILFQFVLNAVNFYKEYKNLNELEKFNDFSAIISDLLHRTQQERGAAAGYIGSRGNKFKIIYEEKIKNTDKEIKNYFKFLQHYKNKKENIAKNIEIINKYIFDLEKIRKQVKNLNITLVDELKFYTTMNTNLLTIMDKLVMLTNNDELVKGLSAYDNFEKAKEKMGIERAVLSGTFSINEWFKELYIKFVTLLAEQKSFLETSMSMSSKDIRNLYNKIKKDKTFLEVARMEKIALMNNNDFGVDAVYWYKTITKKLNLLDTIAIKMYHHNSEIIKKIRCKLIQDMLLNLGITLMILFSVFYILYLIKKETELLINKAIYDQLTGLYNRDFFISEFYISKARADRNGKKIAIIFIDLDGFKDINDSLGHEIGDKVLIEISKRLKKHIRKSDIVARFGGDEFLIMINDIDKHHIKKVVDIAEKILKDIKKPIIVNNIENRVSASIGISIYPDDGDNIHILIKNADMSMYKSKNAGKDRITFYENKMSKESDTRLKLKNDIYNALQNNQFELYYQPQIDKDNKLVGMEALIRWNHPELGLVSPFKFVPLAIEIGIIEEVDLWVMKNSILQIKEWVKKGYNIGVISCNLTIYQLERGSLVDKLKAMFNEIEISPKYFGLEITEEGIMKNPDKNIAILKEIKELGITLSIDDFGTGYSSFAYLKKLPIDKLKIDRTFIKDIPDDEDDKIISAAIISLAKQLHLETVAEGVETQVQRDFVFSHGCNSIQGYFYSPPIPADEFEKKFLISNS